MRQVSVYEFLQGFKLGQLHYFTHLDDEASSCLQWCQNRSFWNSSRPLDFTVAAVASSISTSDPVALALQSNNTWSTALDDSYGPGFRRASRFLGGDFIWSFAFWTFLLSWVNTFFSPPRKWYECCVLKVISIFWEKALMTHPHLFTGLAGCCEGLFFPLGKLLSDYSLQLSSVILLQVLVDSFLLDSMTLCNWPQMSSSLSLSPCSQNFLTSERLTERGPQTFAFTSSFERQNHLQVRDVFRFSISSGRTRLTRVPLASLLATAA